MRSEPTCSERYVRKQAKEHGARKLIEGLAPGETLQGKRVAVVDRLEGAEATFRAASLPFTALLTAADFR